VEHLPRRTIGGRTRFRTVALNHLRFSGNCQENGVPAEQEEGVFGINVDGTVDLPTLTGRGFQAPGRVSGCHLLTSPTLDSRPWAANFPQAPSMKMTRAVVGCERVTWLVIAQLRLIYLRLPGQACQ
jgi:hypothetical protein